MKTFILFHTQLVVRIKPVGNIFTVVQSSDMLVICYYAIIKKLYQLSITVMYMAKMISQIN